MIDPVELGIPDDLRDAILAHVVAGQPAGDDLVRRVADTDGAEGYLLLVQTELPRFFATYDASAAEARAAAELRSEALATAVEERQLAKLGASSGEVGRSAEVVELKPAAGAGRRWLGWAALGLAAAAVALFVTFSGGDGRGLAEGPALAAELAPGMQAVGVAGDGRAPYVEGYRNALVLALLAPSGRADEETRRDAADAILSPAERSLGLDALVDRLDGEPCTGFEAGPDLAECRVGVELLTLRAALSSASADPERWAGAATSPAAERVLALAEERVPELVDALAVARAALRGDVSPSRATAAWDQLTRQLLEL